MSGYRSIWAAAFVAAPLQLEASEVIVSLSTDTRGVFVFIEDRFAPIRGSSRSSSSSRSGAGSSGSSGSSTPRDSRSLQLVPTHSLQFKYAFSDNMNLTYGIHARASRTQLRLKYPNGVTLSSSSPVIRFTEPVQFDLTSVDVGLGPYIAYQLSPRISVSASLLAVRQKIELKSKLGNWDLKDTFYRSFMEQSASIQLQPFLGESMLLPRLYSSISRIDGRNEFTVGADLINFQF